MTLYRPLPSDWPTSIKDLKPTVTNAPAIGRPAVSVTTPDNVPPPVGLVDRTTVGIGVLVGRVVEVATVVADGAATTGDGVTDGTAGGVTDAGVIGEGVGATLSALPVVGEATGGIDVGELALTEIVIVGAEATGFGVSAITGALVDDAAGIDVGVSARTGAAVAKDVEGIGVDVARSVADGIGATV